MSLSKQDLFKAYFDCRKNKRNTINSLKFEIDYENELKKLFEEIITKEYKIKKSICFIVDKPIKREIFAGDFRDRVVHHLIINKLNKSFEADFIFDSYACRKQKGTHFGIERISRFVRQCSKNYTQDCFILKLDIQGFFMSINKDILYKKVWNCLWQDFWRGKFDSKEFEVLEDVIQKITFHDCTKNCFFKSTKSKWKGLPKNKSLFYSKENCGLPIGNLTSQIFANVYMSEFDHYIKSTEKIRYYGRYVDDFVIIHQDKQFLKNLVSKIKKFLTTELGLTLHPKKIYLEHYSKGVKFLGAIILPYRILSAKPTKGGFSNSVHKFIFDAKRYSKDIKNIIKKHRSPIFSYLGTLQHYNTNSLILKNLKKIRSLNVVDKDYFEFISKIRQKAFSKDDKLSNHQKTLDNSIGGGNIYGIDFVNCYAYKHNRI